MVLKIDKTFYYVEWFRPALTPPKDKREIVEQLEALMLGLA